MLIKKPHTGTRLGLGDVDPVQPLNLAHPLMRGVQGFWLPLPHLAGGSRLYDLSPYGRHGSLSNLDPSTVWSITHKNPLPFIRYDGAGQTQVVDSPAWSLSNAPALTVFVHFKAEVLDEFFQTIIANGEGDNWRIARSTTSDTAIGFNVASASRSLDVGPFLGSELFCFLSWNGSIARIAVMRDQSIVTDTAEATQPGTSNTLMIGNNPGATGRRWKGPIYNAIIKHSYETFDWALKMRRQARRGFPDLLNRRPAMTVVDMAVAPPEATEADVTTTQAAQLTSADSLVYRTLDAATLQALQTVSAIVTGIFDASASTRQQQQRAEAAADVVATITLDAVTRQAQQGTAASVLLRAKIDALTRQQPQLAQVAAEIVGIISAAAETRQQPQRATADLQSTISVSVGTQQQSQTAAATALVATILQTVTRQLPQRTTAAFGDLVRARIQATSIRRAIDLQTSITRP